MAAHASVSRTWVGFGDQLAQPALVRVSAGDQLMPPRDEALELDHTRLHAPVLQPRLELRAAPVGAVWTNWPECFRPLLSASAFIFLSFAFSAGYAAFAAEYPPTL